MRAPRGFTGFMDADKLENSHAGIKGCAVGGANTC